MRDPDEANDPWQNVEIQDFIKHANESLLPKLSESSIVVSLAPIAASTDIKFAVELGLAIMLDKPIIVVHDPDIPISEALRKAAHTVLTADLDTDDGKDRVTKAILKLVRELEIDLHSDKESDDD